MKEITNENYPSNDDKGKPEKTNPRDRDVEKVVTGEVVRKKRSIAKRWRDNLVPGDTESVGAFLFWDVFTPAIKNTLADLVTQGIERSLFGESTSTLRGPRGRGAVDNRNYSKYYSGFGSDPREPQTLSRRARASHSFDDIVLTTRGEAEQVLFHLAESIKRYDQATVAELYQRVGIHPEYTDRNWGWDDLRTAGVTRLRNGTYVLDLPPAHPLD